MLDKEAIFVGRICTVFPSLQLSYVVFKKFLLKIYKLFISQDNKHAREYEDIVKYKRVVFLPGLTVKIFSSFSIFPLSCFCFDITLPQTPLS
jgi:hypothetical protein